MRLKSVSQEDTVMAERIWCSEYSTNKKNPCMSFVLGAAICVHLLESKSIHLMVSINTKVVVFWKTASTQRDPSKSSFNEWVLELGGSFFNPMRRWCQQWCFHCWWWPLRHSAAGWTNMRTAFGVWWWWETTQNHKRTVLGIKWSKRKKIWTWQSWWRALCWPVVEWYWTVC